MEGVEDIPGTALWEGIDWRWESFPEYLDALAERPRMMDVGTHVPHAAVRGVRDGRPRRQRRRDARRPRGDGRHRARRHGRGCARHLDVAHPRPPHQSRRRGTGHLRRRGRADRARIGVLRERGNGVFEVVPRGMDGEVSEAAHAELELLGRLAAHAGTRLTFSVVQTHTELDRWRLILDRSAELRDQGVPIYPQVANRATGILFGLQSKNNVFCTRPSYIELAALPLADRLARMRDPAGARPHPRRTQRRVGPPAGIVRVRDVLEHAARASADGVGTDARRHHGRHRRARGSSRRRRSSTTSSPRATAATW